MKVKPGFEGLCYCGTDPTGRGGILRIALGDMSQEQLRGWLRMDYETASRYIQGAVRQPVKAEKIDNQPGAPLPKKPKYEAETDREKDSTRNKPETTK